MTRHLAFLTRSVAVVAVGALATFASHVASAQVPGGGMGGGMGRGMPGKSGGPEGPPSRRADDARPSPMQFMPLSSIVPTELAELRAQLAIEPSQRPAWDRYSQSVLQLLDDIMRVSETVVPGDMTALQRLEQLADLARNRLTATEDLVDAGKALYVVLTPGQRAVADRRMADVVRPLFGARPTTATAISGGPSRPMSDGSTDPRPASPPQR
jgi:hypothetical protein